jgi:hypothetical protein
MKKISETAGTPRSGAPMSAEGLKAAMEAGQLPATATEQAIGGRKANPTPKSNPSPALKEGAEWKSPEQLEKPEKSVAPTENIEKPKKPKKEKKTAMKPIIEKIFVRHDFVDGEMAGMGRELGKQQRDMLDIEAQLTSIKSDFKARKDKVVAEVNRLSNALNDGYAMREVESLVLVAINADKTCQKAYYERATGKFIKAEPFAVDGQLDLFALHPKPKDIKKKLSEKIIKSAV